MLTRQQRERASRSSLPSTSSGTRPCGSSAGEFDRVVARAADPVAYVERLVEAGARLIHLVDLDGARSGHARPELVQRLAEAAAPGRSPGVGRYPFARGRRSACWRPVRRASSSGPRRSPSRRRSSGTRARSATVSSWPWTSGTAASRSAAGGSRRSSRPTRRRNGAPPQESHGCCARPSSATARSPGPISSCSRACASGPGLPVLAAGGIRLDRRPRRDRGDRLRGGDRRPGAARSAPSARDPRRGRVAGLRDASTLTVPWRSTESTWTPSSWRDAPGEPAARSGLTPPRSPQRASGSACCRRSCSPARPERSLPSLGEVCEGRALLLQAGDCAESFRDVVGPDHPREAEGAAPDVGRPDLRRDAPGREGRPHRGPVREAAQRADGDRRRRRASDVPRPRRPLRRADARGPRPGPRADGAGLLPGRIDAEPAPRVHEGRLRRPDPRPHVEPRVRRELARRSALRGARRRDRARAPLHAGDRHRPLDASGRCTRSTSGRATTGCSSSTRRR